MDLAPPEILQTLNRQLRRRIRYGADAQSDECLLEVEADHLSVQDLSFEELHGFREVLGQKVHIPGQTGEVFRSVDDQARGRVHEGRVLPFDDGAVFQGKSDMGAAKSSKQAQITSEFSPKGETGSDQNSTEKKPE